MRPREALFIISVAARLVDMHPSTLRKYERVGFLEPSRVGGKLRLYSTEDIDRLRQIKHLVEDRSVNLAGVEMALNLTTSLTRLRQALRRETDTREARQQMRLLVDRMLALVGAASSQEEVDA